MKKKVMIMFLTIALLMTACQQTNDESLPGRKPPPAKVEIQNQLYETKLASYCWNSKNVGRCVDAIGPVEMLEGKSPISVAPGEPIRFVMDYEPPPNQFHVNQFHDNELTAIEYEDWQFSAPVREGIYYYSIGVWWKDEERKHVSNGSADYYIVIDVSEK